MLGRGNKVAPAELQPPERREQAEEEEEEADKPKRTAKRFFRYSNSWRRPSDATSETSSHDGGDEEAVDIGRGDPSLFLVHYFTKLAENQSEEIDFTHMERLIERGANINNIYDGHSILHDVAANWAVTVAEFLLERGADIHLVDSQGRTSVHIAASTDHAEMVECLLKHGAELDCRTPMEKQTPIHHAARSDSLRTLQVLIEHGGDYEARDYKGRTPLHLAAELDRTAAAEYLLGLEDPAECHVCDDSGNSALVSMIRTMPNVASLALDQLHRLTPADRKQFFLLSYLEPEPGNQTRGVKTPFEVAVEGKSYDILIHPVMKELVKQKWKSFVRYHFYLYLLLYVVFLLSWTLLISYPSVQEKHSYVFPRDIWRILLELVAVATYLHLVVEEIMEFVRSRAKHKHYAALRTRSLQDDLANTDITLPEERKYLEYELAKATKSRAKYFRDPWNVIDVITFGVLFVVVVMHSIDVAAHSTALALWTARVSCIAVILIWIRLLKHGRGFKSIGPLIAIIGQLIGDIIKYFIIFAIFFIPYMICFWVLFGGDQSKDEQQNDDLSSFHRTAIVLFRMTLVDDYPYTTLRDIDELMAAVLVISFLVLVAVIGINLFIALLSDTFQRVYDNAQANAEMQQARIILSLEEKASKCWRERYLRHIHSNCSPSSKYYDDDDTRSLDKTPSQLQKITHQIHTIVSSLQVERDEARSTEQPHSLDARLEKQEEAILHISQHLAEIKNLLFAMQRDGRGATNQTAAVRSSPILEDAIPEDDHPLASPDHPQRSHDHPQRSHDHPLASHDHPQRSHDHPQRSHDHPQGSHDHPQRSHDHPQGSPDHHMASSTGRTDSQNRPPLRKIPPISKSPSTPLIISPRTRSGSSGRVTRTESTRVEYDISNHRRRRKRNAMEMKEVRWAERVQKPKK